MLKMTLVNVLATVILAAGLEAGHINPILAATPGATATVTSAAEINVSPLLGKTRVEIAALYPSLDAHEIDKLVMRAGEALSMALLH